MLERPRCPEITDVTMYINMPSDIYPTHFGFGFGTMNRSCSGSTWGGSTANCKYIGGGK